MTTVGAYQAKTHLPRLLDQVSKGEIIQITKHGVPVANLVPVNLRSKPDKVIEELRQFRKGKKLNGLSVQELIGEGRE